jgi:Carboxypeptidase regulatory-like domain
MKNLLLKLLIASTVCLTLSQNMLANTYYFDITGLDPFIQKWTDTSLLPVNDYWGDIVSVAAYRGDSLTSGIGVNPQTILNDTPGNPLNVTANETNPNTSTAEGAVEFEIANPVVALRPSDTANAPNLVIRVNSTGCSAGKTLTVAYDVRDIDGSARNSISPIALQYRYSASGNYINLPDGYVADATFGPNSDTKVTPVFAVLPPTSINQPNLTLRIIGANAVGSDEFVGIDNIQVYCVGAPTAANSSISGKVQLPSGRGISQATVSLFNTTDNTFKSVNTNQFGRYAFNDLPAGDFYILSVSHRRYAFTPNTREIQLSDNLDDIGFVADIAAKP